ncbi:RNA 2',3'-cyclic phosphodiesterase [Streptomyces fuscigenes]|uniref:RNA 2',3'-cyclic phosphodiesterase n=1 Tax=Streptomyces fuscigenes TaxID=1528880 RepID=UPI001F27F931|nr:RNA 2',3'-cyclic phosphodiesterase [Streptomyces fuscigenes]MCF3963131.1 RNA 2',3'-cyclic phosphodiesterase [Streptomyces fuscigenes]
MRLFAAVLPPDEATDALRAAVAPLHGLPGADRLRWTAEEAWHFTVVFLGEVDEELLPAFDERLTRAARRCAPFALRVRGGGHFGGRALWAGADGALPELRRLAERAGAAARRAGIGTQEHRAYRPHLTLARAPAPAPGEAGVDLDPYAERLGGVEGPVWQVTDLCLVRSRLPDGRTPGARPRYETLARRPLGRGR